MVAKDDILNVLKTINTERGDKDIVDAGHILEIGIVDDYINIRFALPNNDQSAKCIGIQF